MRILYWGRGGGGEGGGEGANKQAPERLTCRGFRGNSPPKQFEILKLCYRF